MEITKKFTFSAGHFVPDHPKCGHQHGHNFDLEVTVKGNVKENGMVMDFHDLKSIVGSYVVDKLDHTNLNDRFTVPTSENVGIWIWEQLEEP